MYIFFGVLFIIITTITYKILKGFINFTNEFKSITKIKLDEEELIKDSIILLCTREDLDNNCKEIIKLFNKKYNLEMQYKKYKVFKIVIEKIEDVREENLEFIKKYNINRIPSVVIFTKGKCTENISLYEV